MDVQVLGSRFHGRSGELDKFKEIMDDYRQSYTKRKAAARNYYKIIEQCNDDKLMEYRLRLIRAAQAGDRDAVGRISSLMKRYLGEDAESGVYDN